MIAGFECLGPARKWVMSEDSKLPDRGSRALCGRDGDRPVPSVWRHAWQRCDSLPTANDLSVLIGRRFLERLGPYRRHRGRKILRVEAFQGRGGFDTAR